MIAHEPNRQILKSHSPNQDTHLPIGEYYHSRRKMNYYWVAMTMIDHHVPLMKSILDVGCFDVPFVTFFKKCQDKNTIDLRVAVQFPDTRHYTANFLDFDFKRKFEVVSCLQVLEHLEDPRPFTQKLFASAECAVLISIPFKWAKGDCKYHKQDPVDQNKLLEWTKPFVPTELKIVQNGKERLVAIYQMK